MLAAAKGDVSAQQSPGSPTPGSTGGTRAAPAHLHFSIFSWPAVPRQTLKEASRWGQLLLLPQRYCAFFGEPSLWPKNMHKNSACAYAHTVLAPVFVADSPKVEGMRDLCIIHLNNKYKAKTYKKCMNFCESLKSLNFAFWYVGLSGCVFLKLFLIPKVRNFVKETEHKEIRLSTSPSSR